MSAACSAIVVVYLAATTTTLNANCQLRFASSGLVKLRVLCRRRRLVRLRTHKKCRRRRFCVFDWETLVVVVVAGVVVVLLRPLV